MIGIDTNVLVRWITQDDTVQCKKVDALFKKHLKSRGIFISDIVLIELEWVLESVYNFQRKQIIDVLYLITRVQQFCFRNSETISKAIEKFSTGGKDFSDCLIGEIGHESGCKTFTFDKALKGNPAFIVLK